MHLSFDLQSARVDFPRKLLLSKIQRTNFESKSQHVKRGNGNGFSCLPCIFIG